MRAWLPMPKSTSPALDRIGDPRADELDEPHCDPRMVDIQLTYGFRQDARGDRRQRTDGHDSALMVGELMTRHRDRIHFIDDPFDRTKQIPPGLGQRDMPFVAIEELDAQRMFEL